MYGEVAGLRTVSRFALCLGVALGLVYGATVALDGWVMLFHVMQGGQ